MYIRQKWLPYVYILPSVVILLLVVGYPLLFGFNLSFTNMSLRNFREYRYIGFTNYQSIFESGELFSIFMRTIVWTVVNVFFHVLIGVWLALMLNRKLPGKGLVRVLLMIPWAMPQYIAVMTWRGMFNYQYGAINILLSRIGIEPISWLTNGNWAFAASIITNIWLGFSFMMLITLGGLQSIPQELYEAAEVDGAKPFQQLKKITLPLLKPVLSPAIVLGTVWTFNMVNVIVILTDGFDKNETHILVTKVFRAAFGQFRYGYAAAFSVVIFFILAIFASTFIKAMKGKKEGN